MFNKTITTHCLFKLIFATALLFNSSHATSTIAVIKQTTRRNDLHPQSPPLVSQHKKHNELFAAKTHACMPLLQCHTVIAKRIQNHFEENQSVNTLFILIDYCISCCCYLK